MAIATMRELWRRRYSVGIGLVYAFIVIILMSYRVSLGLPPKIESRQYDAGIAATDVLVDSPNSQVVDVGGGGGDDVDAATIDLGGLSTRARLLASLMSSSPLKDRIASAAGIKTTKLIVIAPTGDDLAPRVTSSTSTTVKPGDRDANVLGLYVDETLPILTMQVQAPDAGTAERLATSAVAELGDYLKSVASADNVPDARQLVVEPLGQASSATVVKGPRKLFAILAGLLVLVIWCVGTIGVPRLVRTWRDAARAEAEAEAEAAGAHPAPATNEPNGGAGTGSRARPQTQSKPPPKAPVKKPAKTRAKSRAKTLSR